MVPFGKGPAALCCVTPGRCFSAGLTVPSDMEGKPAERHLPLFPEALLRDATQAQNEADVLARDPWPIGVHYVRLA